MYSNAGLSATKKVKAYTFLNLVGPDALEKYYMFTFEREVDQKDSKGNMPTSEECENGQTCVQHNEPEAT